MYGRTKSVWLRYGSAVIAVLSAKLLCLLVDPFIEGHLYYVWFLLAIVFTGWYAGFRPSLVCFVLSVPVVVYFSEDRYEVARYGERTLSQYRSLAAKLGGPGCPTGIVAAGDPLLAQIAQDWLDEFERVQWMLRLSPRLRARHDD